MACEDQINTEDLINAKTDATTLGEVATSRAGAVEGGVPITTSTNRFDETTDTIQGRLNKLGVLFDDPIRDWSASLLVSDLRAHRYPATTGDIYIPVKELPFTTDGTFNTDNWELFQGVTDVNKVIPFDTLQAAIDENSILMFEGAALNIAERTSGNGGGAMWDVVLASSVTPNTYNIVQCVGVYTLALVLREGDIVHASQFGLVLGVQDTELPSQNAVIAVLIATRKYVAFGEGVVWLDVPVVIDLGTATGEFWEGTGYGQKFISNRTTFSARTDFVGDELVELAAPDSGIQGWVNFQCNGIVKHGCKMTGAQTQILEGGRTYGWTQSGILINLRFGQQVGPFQGGDFQPGAKALIEANDTTGIKVTSPQLFRAPTGIYLFHFTAAVDFTVIGGTPDKCDEGIYISVSQGKWLSGNLEGVKRPMFIDRSWFEFSGRAIALGGLAKSPENSTDEENLDIGTDETRKAGTSLVIGLSARVRLTQILGTSWDFENDLNFSDLSGDDSNELYIGQIQEKEGNFRNCIIPQTMVIGGDEDTELVATNTTDYLVRGSGSGQNQIVPNNTLIKSGFDVSFEDFEPPAVNLWYVVQVTGVYEIELTFDLEADTSNPANTVVFSVLNKNLNATVYTSPSILVPANPNGEPIIIRFKSNLGVGNGYRIQGVTDALVNRALLKNLSLKIKRIGNIV